MLLAHRIRIDATAIQRDYFARAAGTARRVWNWALAEWNRQAACGLRPNAMALKKVFNRIKYSDPDWLDADGKPWLRAIHRDAHAQPFANLAKAWSRYFEQRRASQPAHAPRFKKKGRSADAFYLANDKFRLEGRSAVLPKVGRVALREALRWDGKIMGASVSREAGHWHLAVQVDVPDHLTRRRRTGDAVTGIDLGVTSAATLSSGEKIAAPRPLKAALRRLRIRSRRQSRKLEAAKAAAGIVGRIGKGTRLQASKNRTKGALALARLHARIARVRQDFTHKLTTRLCRENQALVIEDLNVRGMLANARLARAIADVGFSDAIDLFWIETCGNHDDACRVVLIYDTPATEWLANSAAIPQFGYLDLGKRESQRVLAVRATERAYLDLPVYGSGIVAGHGRTEIARCEVS